MHDNYDTTDTIEVTVDEIFAFLKKYLKETSADNETIYQIVAKHRADGTLYGKYTMSVRNACGIIGRLDTPSPMSVIVLEFKAHLKNMFVEFEIVPTR